MYKNNELTVYLDPQQNNKVMEIYDEFGRIYNRKPVNISPDGGYNSTRVYNKPTLKSFIRQNASYTIPNEFDLQNKIVTPAYMGDLELYDYYNSLCVDDEDITLLHYGVTQNKLIDRGFLQDMPLNKLDDFTIDFGFNYENQ